MFSIIIFFFLSFLCPVRTRVFIGSAVLFPLMILSSPDPTKCVLLGTTRVSSTMYVPAGKYNLAVPAAALRAF